VGDLSTTQTFRNVSGSVVAVDDEHPTLHNAQSLTTAAGFAPPRRRVVEQNSGGLIEPPARKRGHAAGGDNTHA
jgi:hypothetical protein